jgi:hypothetical protein
VRIRFARSGVVSLPNFSWSSRAALISVIGKARARHFLRIFERLYTENQLEKVFAHHLVLTIIEAIQTVNRRWRIQPATEGKWKWLAECTRQARHVICMHLNLGVRLFPLHWWA